MTDAEVHHDETGAFSRRSVLRSGAAVAGVAVVGVGMTGSAAATICVRTPGYWKNHPDAWPVDSLEIGGETYSIAELLAILDTKPKGYKDIIMMRHLIAAKLNIENGANHYGRCVDNPISNADGWLIKYAPTKKWHGGEKYKDKLEGYNEGRRCATGCD